MTARRIDQIWLLGGLVAILVLVAATWFFVISPTRDKTIVLNGQAEETTMQLAKLKQKVADLEAKNKKLTGYQDTLTARQNALPTEYRTTDFLRQLQDTGTAVNIQVSGISVAAPTASKAVTTVVELPIMLTAAGSAANLSEFLDRLQNVQSRAVLLYSVNVTADPAGKTPDAVTATLNLKAFCTPPTDPKKTNTCLAKTT